MKKVKKILGTHPVVTINEEDTVLKAAQVMAENGIGGLPVLSGNRLVGIFTERDMINRVVAKGLEPSQTKVNDVMSSKLVVVGAEETYDKCLKILKQAKIRHLPVVEQDNLIGIISIRDLIMTDINEKEEKIEFLERYIIDVPPGPTKKYT